MRLLLPELSDADMRDVAAILTERGYPGGTQALAADAREWIADCEWADIDEIGRREADRRPGPVRSQPQGCRRPGGIHQSLRLPARRQPVRARGGRQPRHDFRARPAPPIRRHHHHDPDHDGGTGGDAVTALTLAPPVCPRSGHGAPLSGGPVVWHCPVGGHGHEVHAADIDLEVAPLTAMTTWERHAAGLPARDKDERARYAELDRCAARPGTASRA